MLLGIGHTAHAADGVVQTGSNPAPFRAISSRPLPDYSPYIGLLDTRVPLAQRQALFARIQRQADTGDITAQYFVGSLYRVGDKLQASPVPTDLAKARMYLSNAAIHGHLYAMAKMAEIGLDTGNYREAMNWAQIYAHYLRAEQLLYEPAQNHYVAELLGRISKGFDKNQYPAVVYDLNTFLANYDADIRAGISVTRQIRMEEHSPFVKSSSRFATPRAGFADFLIAIKPDGSVENAWLLDGTPDLSVGYHVRDAIMEMKAPAEPGAGLRYTWRAQAWNDRECHECVLEYERKKH